MPSWPAPVQLRQCALAVAVIHDVDLTPSPHGVLLPGEPEVHVTWAECRRAIAGAEATSETAQLRLKHWLTIRRQLATLPLEELAERAGPFGVYVESEDHPGIDWVRRRVLGDTLDLGFGFVGLDPKRPDTVIPVQQQILRAAAIEPSSWWPNAVEIGRAHV